MKSKLIFPFLLLMIFVSAQRNPAKDSARKAIIEQFNLERVFVEKGKSGLKNTKGKKVLKPVYDDISLDNKIIFLRKDSLVGMADFEGEILVPVIYKNVERFYDFIAATDFQDVTALFDAGGKVIYPAMIYGERSFSGRDEKGDLFVLRVFDNSLNKIYGLSSKQLFRRSESNLEVIKIPGYDNNTHSDIDLNFEGFQYSDINARLFIEKNKNVIAYKTAKDLWGYYNVETQKSLPPDFGYLEYDKFSDRIYLSKNGFYNISVDRELGDYRENNDSVYKINMDNFYIKENGKTRLRRNNIKSSFTYPEIEPYYDQSRYLYYPISSEKLKFYETLFKYYENKGDKKFGIINFEGKIYTPAIYDEIYVKIFDPTDDYNLRGKEHFFKENKLDIITLGIVKNSDGSETIDIRNNDGEIFITESFEKDIDFYPGNLSFGNFTERGNFFLTANPQSNKGYNDIIFHMYNFKTGKLLLKTNREVISEVSVVGYKTVFTDYSNHRNLIKFYNNDLKKIGEYLLKGNNQSNIFGNLWDWPTFPFSNENNKFGLKDYSENILIPPVYDEITIIGNGFNIVSKDSKYGIVNDYNNIWTPLEHTEIKLDPYSRCLHDAATWKKLLCWDANNEIIR